MKRKITFLIAVIMLLTIIALPETVLGQTRGYTELFTINSSDVVGSGYGYYTYTDGSSRGFLVTYGGGNNAVGSNKNNISNCKLTSYTKYAVSPVTTSNTASAFACTSSISNVSKISFKVGGGEYSTTQVYLIYSSDDKTYSQVSLTGTTEQGCSITTSAQEFEFSPLSGYFALVFKSSITNAAWRNQNVEIKFYKTTYNITYNANEATGGSVPSATTHDAGSNATVASNTGSLVRTGYNFSGWNTKADGYGTNYVEGATINSISQDYTLYAKWTLASSPNIVVSGEGISSNALNLAYTASGDKTATASFNNMTGYTSPTVTRYNNLACTESFSGDWFSASLSGSTITYNASANAGAARTVYMRVSAVYDKTTYYSNVITVTQNALPCTVTYNSNGGSGSMSDGDSPYAYGSTVTVLDNEFTAPTGKVFYKWNTAPDGSGTFYVKDDPFTIGENTTLYAIWHDIPTYTKITSVSQIIPGAHYVVVGTKTDGTTVKAMDAQNGTYRNAVDVTINAKDTNNDGEDDTYYLEQAGLYEFVISGYTNNYTIYDETNATPGYLYHSGDKNVNVRASIGNDNAALWKITLDSDGLFEFNNVSASTYYLQFNSGSPRFTDYTGTQRNCYLFLKDNDTDCNIYSATTLSKNESYTNLIIVKNTNVNGSITVPNAKTLTVTGDLTNGTAANLVIEDGGQLILADDNSVAATVNKTVNKPNGTWGNDDASGWYAISSPVGNIAPGSVTNLTLPMVSSVPQYDLYRYDEDMGWYNSQHSGQSISTLEKGHGYLYARSANASLSYAGTVTSASFDIENLSKSDVKHSGLHLIGNPYTHDIYLGAAITGDLTTTGYYALNASGSWISTANTTPIKPEQAVFVFVTKDDATISFNNTASAPAAKAHHDYIRFTVANSQYEDVAYAMFDKGYGLNKIEHRNSEAPMIYIPQNDDNYAIAMMEDNTQMFALNFKAATTGKYTLSYNTKGEFSYLHVIDRLTGEDVDMLLEDEYEFMASKNDNANRFIVKLEYSENPESSGNSVFAWQNGNDIIVNGEGELQVFDVMGRLVMTTNVNGMETINVKSQGVYIFRLNGMTQKIVVR